MLAPSYTFEFDGEVVLVFRLTYKLHLVWPASNNARNRRTVLVRGHRVVPQQWMRPGFEDALNTLIAVDGGDS